MIDWPANSSLFWLTAAASVVLLFYLSSLRAPAPAAFSIQGKPKQPVEPPRLLRRRFVAAWIAAILSAAITPSFMNFWLFGDTGWRGLSPTDQVLVMTGVSVLAFSLVLVCVALWGDRAKGRSRCPSCWYDMAGSPSLTCPECGKAVRSNSSLLRTRRSWKSVALAALLVLVGIGLIATPVATGPNWRTYVPLPVLVLLNWPANKPLHDEVMSRLALRNRIESVNGKSLTLGERILLARCRLILRSSKDATEIQAALDASFYFGADIEDLTKRVLELLDDPSVAVQQSAATLLGFASSQDRTIGQRLLDKLQNAGPNLQGSLAAALRRRAGIDPANNLDAALSSLEIPANFHRDSSWMWLQQYRSDPRVIAWARKSLGDPIIGPSAELVILSNSPADPEARAALLRELRTGNPRPLDMLIWEVAVRLCNDPELVGAAVEAMPRVGSGWIYPSMDIWNAEEATVDCRKQFAVGALKVVALRPMLFKSLPMDPDVRQAFTEALAKFLPTLDPASEDGKQATFALQTLNADLEAYHRHRPPRRP